LLATDLEQAPERKKIAIMLHMGQEGREIYNSFNINIDTVTLEQVKQRFETYFES